MAALAWHFGPRWIFDPRRFEVLKWLALGSMILDHVSIFWGNHTGPFYEIGRFAYPIFTITFGIGLALSSDQQRVLTRLLAPGLIAELAWRVSGHSPGLNVLLGFFTVGAACVLFNRSRLVACMLLAVPALVPGFESGALLPLLVAGAYCSARSRSVLALLILAALSAWLLGTVGALAALIALFLAPPLQLPRFRWLAWCYAGHLGIFAALTL